MTNLMLEEDVVLELRRLAKKEGISPEEYFSKMIKEIRDEK